MKLGLLTRNSKAWCSTQILKAIKAKRMDAVCFRFSDLLARVAYNPKIEVYEEPFPTDIAAVIVRPIGRGSLDEIIFKLDLLHRLERLGTLVVNCPSAIEKAVDKFYSLSLLEENGIKVPRTVVTQSSTKALKKFKELGEDVIVKPIFGSRGIGVIRVSDYEIARRIFRSLVYFHKVLYIQEFIPHGNRDIRAFVIGESVVASMYRVSQNWKTNISQGAEAIAFKATEDLEKLAVKASKILGCEISGIDLMESPNGYVINEINSQPGFRGLQSTTKVDIAEKIVDHVVEISK